MKELEYSLCAVIGTFIALVLYDILRLGIDIVRGQRAVKKQEKKA